jgi:hypothetical protein
LKQAWILILHPQKLVVQKITIYKNKKKISSRFKDENLTLLGKNSKRSKTNTAAMDDSLTLKQVQIRKEVICY